MSVTQLRPRKLAISSRGMMLDIVDALDTEIRFATAIDLAIAGEANICGFDCSTLCTLSTVHIERLGAIREKLEALRIGGAS